jgi:hypothetical protein
MLTFEAALTRVSMRATIEPTNGLIAAMTD